MKQLSMIIVMAFMIGAQGIAQDEQFTEDVRSLMQVNGSLEMFEMTSDQLIQQFQTQNANVPDSAWTSIKDDIIQPAFEDLKEQMIPVYKKHFTHQQIKDLIDLYNTETGKMLVEKQPLIQQEVMPVSREWGMQLAKDIQKEIRKY